MKYEYSLYFASRLGRSLTSSNELLLRQVLVRGFLRRSIGLGLQGSLGLALDSSKPPPFPFFFFLFFFIIINKIEF